MNNNLQLVLGGTGSDIYVTGFIPTPKVVKHKQTGQSFWLKSKEGEFVILEPIMGQDKRVKISDLNSECWEIQR